MAVAVVRGRRNLQVVPAPARRPAVPNVVLGTLAFLAAEVMFFGGLVSSLLILRAGAGPWPPPGQPRLPLEVTAANTLVLLASFWTVGRIRAVRGGGRREHVSWWLTVTVVLGAAFLAVQGIEWVRLVRHGLRLSPGIYGALFATVIGSHGLHVLGGLVVLAVTWRRAQRSIVTLRDDTLMAVELYWRFVVMVWPILYVLVYIV
jgi:heme/copper-type cytochrome/quinol oxidase subunit 3